MYYYRHQNYTIASQESLPREKLPGLSPWEELFGLPPEGAVICTVNRPPLQSRENFFVSHPALLVEKEGVDTLDGTAPVPENVPLALRQAIYDGRVRAVNQGHPRWAERLLPEFPAAVPTQPVRVHLLALGDVGSTLALGLRLASGGILSALGLFDVRQGMAERWAFELNQVVFPEKYDALPPVEPVSEERLFDCDIFLFCASRMIPDNTVKSGDVRMAQLAANRPLAEEYARRARDAHFRGLFGVISDPVDPLCAAILWASNRDETGQLDYQGLFPNQVRGFGLGVMNARAAYYARREPVWRSYREDGRVFGPHGEGLLAVNSLSRYDAALTQALTEKTLQANLELRAMGYKPYAAPALSSGTLSLLALLKGEWQYSSVCLDGVYFGVKNRLTPEGIEIERPVLPADLRERIQASLNSQRNIQSVCWGDALP